MLTRQRFVTAVRTGLDKAGIDSSKYSGHSFRIGAATTAAQNGMEDSIIKTLGRWEMREMGEPYLPSVREDPEKAASWLFEHTCYFRF